MDKRRYVPEKAPHMAKYERMSRSCKLKQKRDIIGLQGKEIVKMGRQKREFTAAEQAALKKNPYTYQVYKTSIR